MVTRAEIVWTIGETALACGLAMGVMLALYDNRVFVPSAEQAYVHVVVGYRSTVMVAAVAVSALVLLPRILFFVCITRIPHRASAKWWRRPGMVGLFASLVLMLYACLLHDCNLYRDEGIRRIIKDECSPWIGVVPSVIVAGLLWGVEFVVVGVCELLVSVVQSFVGRVAASSGPTT